MHIYEIASMATYHFLVQCHRMPEPTAATLTVIGREIRDDDPPSTLTHTEEWLTLSWLERYAYHWKHVHQDLRTRLGDRHEIDIVAELAALATEPTHLSVGLYVQVFSATMAYLTLRAAGANTDEVVPFFLRNIAEIHKVHRQWSQSWDDLERFMRHDPPQSAA